MIENWKDIKKLILKDAFTKAEDAAYSGAMQDGGSSSLKEHVYFYDCGATNTFPKEWKHYTEQYLKINNPEYKEYVRLKRKFEND